MMNLYSNLILVNGEDKTSEIKSCHYENSTYFIVFSSSQRIYPYNCTNVKWLSEPSELNPEHYRISKNGKPFFDVVKLLLFYNYLRVFFNGGKARSYCSDTIMVEKNSLSDKKAENCLEYFKKLANIVSLVTDDGISILSKQYEKISFVPEKTALANFLGGTLSEKQQQEKTTYYPFGCNLSQISAVEKALTNNISVIEGPPGTGKTQTILNIIANIIIDDKNVAIVSGNNSATANVAEKLENYGFGFLVASLGKSEYKKDFIARQSGEYPCFDDYACTDETIEQKRQKIIVLKKELHAIELEQQYFDNYLAETQEVDLNFKGKGLSSVKVLYLLLDINKYENTEKVFSIFFKLKHLFVSGITDFSFYKHSLSEIITTLQSRYYTTKISELANEIATIEGNLKSFDFKEKMSLLSKLSLDVFKSSLHKKYAGKASRKIFMDDDLWKNSAAFAKETTTDDEELIKRLEDIIEELRKEK